MRVPAVGGIVVGCIGVAILVAPSGRTRALHNAMIPASSFAVWLPNVVFRLGPAAPPASRRIPSSAALSSNSRRH